MPAQPRSVRVHFGPAGWSYPDWETAIYRGRGRRALEILAAVFDTVEVNVTFYRPVTAATAANWLRRVEQNPGFCFTAKLWRGFTHERDFADGDVRRYHAGIEPLLDAGRLGALLAQFPWSFKYDEVARDHVARLRETFPEVALVLEVRHSSWNREEALAWLERLEVGFCNIDQPLFPGSLPPTARVTSGTGYVRLHGRNRDAWFDRAAGRDQRYDYRYSRAELAPWAERVRRVADTAGTVFVITNNHFGGSAVANALELRHLYDGVRASVPAGWLDAFPSLAGCCDAERVGARQLSLFERGDA